ncbi:MAG: TfoX/Sxy family protein [Rhodanobacter sp.]|nr:TfoX/Sxy family protein [Rhodanobacter sp.]
MAAKETSEKIRNIGPKSAAWLRQVGIRTREDLACLGAVEAYLKVKRAGFRPSLNLLYALEGALTGRHWADLPEAHKSSLLLAADAAEAANPIKTRWQKQVDRSAAQINHGNNAGDMPVAGFSNDADGGSDDASNRFE